jgi:hypothetical protein
MLILKISVILSFLYCIAALFYLFNKFYSAGITDIYSKSKGNSFKGILYAFTKGMLPSEKESAKIHMFSYIAGVIFHFGIFTALAYLALNLLSLNLTHLLLKIIQMIMIASFICGASLLIKRLSMKTMHSISCYDDYISNILVLSFLMIGIITIFDIRTIALFYFISILLFIYIPAGKIRHCFFFFITRILLGKYFGRRNVFKLK